MLERVDLDRVAVEARQIHLGRAILTLVVGFFWLLGWLAAKLIIGIGTGITYCLAAAKVGWQDAHQPRNARSRVGPA